MYDKNTNYTKPAPYNKPATAKSPELSNEAKAEAERIDKVTAEHVARNNYSAEYVNIAIARFARDLRAQCPTDSDGYKAADKAVNAVGDPLDKADAVKISVLYGDRVHQENLEKEADARRDNEKRVKAKQAFDDTKDAPAVKYSK